MILDALQASRLGIAAETLARRHGWNGRTVYRDLRAVEAAGFPVTAINGRWRLVEGWQRLQKRGRFLVPPSCKAALEVWKGERNSLATFLRECLEITGDEKDCVEAQDVYDSYKNWSQAEGVQVNVTDADPFTFAVTPAGTAGAGPTGRVAFAFAAADLFAALSIANTW